MQFKKLPYVFLAILIVACGSDEQEVFNPDIEAEHIKEARENEFRDMHPEIDLDEIERQEKEESGKKKIESQNSDKTEKPKIDLPKKPEKQMPKEEEAKPQVDNEDFNPPKATNCKYSSSIKAAPPKKRVVLTFDDGPSKSNTDYVLKVLKKHRISATFFMTGVSATTHPEIARRVQDAGHLIVGNHSWSHSNFHKLSNSEQRKEISRTRDTLEQYQKQKFFRFPYGNSTCDSINYAHSLGYRVVGWHIDTCDWGFNRTGSVGAKVATICGVKPGNRDNFVEHVVERVKAQNGGIILMHDVQPNTIKKLDQIISRLDNEGFTFGNLDEKGFRPSFK